jgi:hypothetical protein
MILTYGMFAANDTFDHAKHEPTTFHDRKLLLFQLRVQGFAVGEMGQTAGNVGIHPRIAMASVLLCVVSVVAGIQISNSGGKIRRPDFRTNAGTVQPTGHDTDHDD